MERWYVFTKIAFGFYHSIGDAVEVVIPDISEVSKTIEEDGMMPLKMQALTPKAERMMSLNELDNSLATGSPELLGDVRKL